MGSRWFIPISLLVFAAVVAGLWAYLSSTEEPSPPGWARSAPGLLAELNTTQTPQAANPIVASPTTTTAKQPSRRNATKQQGPRVRPETPVAPVFNRWDFGVSGRTLSQSIQIGERLDEALVKVRGDVAESTAVELLSAQRDLTAGRPESAIERFHRVLKHSPKNTSALSGKAAALVELRSLDKAEAVYADLIRIAPRDASAHYNYGVLLYRLAKYGEASEQFRDVIGLDPNHVHALYNLATLAQRDGRWTEARDTWREFTTRQPQVSGGWMNLGVLMMDADEPLDAMQCFSVFTALAPEDPDGFTNLSRAMIELQDYPNALISATHAMSLSPCEPAALAAFRDIHLCMAEQAGEDAEIHRKTALCINEQLESLD